MRSRCRSRVWSLAGPCGDHGLKGELRELLVHPFRSSVDILNHEPLMPVAGQGRPRKAAEALGPARRRCLEGEGALDAAQRGVEGAMTTRAERQRGRIARLLDQVQSSAQAWADPEYQVGIATGRTGAVSAQLETIRGTAQRRFADVVAKLGAAVTPADDTPRLRLR